MTRPFRARVRRSSAGCSWPSNWAEEAEAVATACAGRAGARWRPTTSRRSFTAIAKGQSPVSASLRCAGALLLEAGRDGSWLHGSLSTSNRQPGGRFREYRSEPAGAPCEDEPARQRQAAGDADALRRASGRCGQLRGSKPKSRKMSGFGVV